MHEEEGGDFTVSREQGGARLDVILAAQLGCSRTRAQQAIEAGDVLVNGRTSRPSHKLRVGDSVEAELPGRVTADAPIVPEALALTVVLEDADLIVIDKPAGMVVHPTGGITRGTLANALVHRWGHEPGLVHRLDRDTSGLMVVARTSAAQDHLTEQFRRREVRKHYVALVYGRLEDRGGALARPIGRDRKNRLKMVCCGPGEGREALTLYTVRAQWQEFALLDVEIKTGRTHQIRVHCSHLGHPVVADEMYGKGRAAQVRSAAHRAAIAALGRQALHAARLAFEHPRTGAALGFEAPLPAEFSAMLAALDRD
jgi:23S rRNA pseudouridine1911/1915/1917 synthase